MNPRDDAKNAAELRMLERHLTALIDENKRRIENLEAATDARIMAVYRKIEDQILRGIAGEV